MRPRFGFFFIVLLHTFLMMSAEVAGQDEPRGRRKIDLARVALDTDPAKAGAQSNLQVLSGTFFTIDVVVNRIDPARPLDVYQFVLEFDPNILRAVNIVNFGFLPDGIVLQREVTAQGVKWAEGKFGDPVSGDGVVATVTFEAMSGGRSPLNLRQVILAGLGDEITAEIDHATVRVKRSQRSR